MALLAENKRLEEYRQKVSNWKHWGPYLSERSWGNVREDYSPNGDAWGFFPHDHARSRAYRWGEDGLCGISDRNQHLCFAFSFWNGKDPILKERLFGLAGPEGNHGEDVKELYFYVDTSPTHSYMKMLYKYSQAEYPYAHIANENRNRSKLQREYEIQDTGLFDSQKYFDCEVEYAKSSESDILIRLTVTNRGPEVSQIHLLPTLWFRNVWSWGYASGPLKELEGPNGVELPTIQEKVIDADRAYVRVEAYHPNLGQYHLALEGAGEALFTENETNSQKLFNRPNRTPYVKDAFHRYLIEGDKASVNPALTGTKVALYRTVMIPPGASVQMNLRLFKGDNEEPFKDFDSVFDQRKQECDAFYNALHPQSLSTEEKRLQRQALGGVLWSKQLYYYDVEQWLEGDPSMPKPSVERAVARNSKWRHLANFDIISMPDKWEFPWYAAWDLAFHTLSITLVDPDFAKRQLELITREWYMHPNGQIPAYEWSFSDVNPPVHVWAAWRVYKIDAKITGKKDMPFLEGLFHKLLLNFTWWVNQKDVAGNNIFQGGFLGLDNIGVFDRSRPLPIGGRIDQSDGTAWMAAYSLGMLRVAIELAKHNPVYQDVASKFLEHFLRVAHAMTNIGGSGVSLWNEEDGFFYDVLHLESGEITPLKVRSLVGLIPLIAVDTIDAETLNQLPDLKRRLKWFFINRPHLSGNIAPMEVPGKGKKRLAALVTKERMLRMFSRMFDEKEFLSEFGLRSLSKAHEAEPYRVALGGESYQISYEPGESLNGMFGGNSNWRGPVWFPTNYLLIEALQRFHHFYGDELKVEYPTRSGNMLNLNQIADDLSKRLLKLYKLKSDGSRPFYGPNPLFKDDPSFKELFLFHEYYNAETGEGLGASHQTGWTSLVAKLLQQTGGGVL
jgi:hypothetical protein